MFGAGDVRWQRGGNLEFPGRKWWGFVFLVCGLGVGGGRISIGFGELRDILLPMGWVVLGGCRLALRFGGVYVLQVHDLSEGYWLHAANYFVWVFLGDLDNGMDR